MKFPKRKSPDLQATIDAEIERLKPREPSLEGVPEDVRSIYGMRYQANLAKWDELAKLLPKTAVQDWPQKIQAYEESLEPNWDDAQEVIEVRPLLAPHAYALLLRHGKDIKYHLVEPPLGPHQEQVRGFLQDTILDVLDILPHESDSPKKVLQDHITKLLADYGVVLGDARTTDAEARERIEYFIMRDFLGEGPIEPLLRDDNIEDISCDGAHVPLFIYDRRYEGLETDLQFQHEDLLSRFVIRMAQRSGAHVSIADPILDATLQDGSRLQATLGHEVTSFGSSFTIRRFRDTPLSTIDLVQSNTVSAELLAYWWLVVEHRMSGIVAGGTASGKTTTMNALMQCIPDGQKVITLEDTRELRVPQDNWLASVTRHGFGVPDAHGRRTGEIDMFELLRAALRQRPEYIVVGEVRGKEAYNLFQAMATGHAAYGTLHADDVEAVIHRLESDPINVPRSMLENLDVVAIQAQTRIDGRRVRRAKSITEILGQDAQTGDLLTHEIFRWEPGSDSFRWAGASQLFERIAVETGRNYLDIEQEWKNRTSYLDSIPYGMSYEDVSAALRSYEEGMQAFSPPAFPEQQAPVIQGPPMEDEEE